VSNPVKQWLNWVKVVLIGLGGISCQMVPIHPVKLTPLPQDPFIQVYFNQSVASHYTDPYRLHQRMGDNLEQVIVEAIGQATSSIDVAIQELRSPQIALALQDRHRSGVRVRVILENTYSRPWSSYSASQVAQLQPRQRARYQEGMQLLDQDQNGHISPDEIQQRDALIILQRSDIPWKDDTSDGSQGSGLQHHKFLVIDGRYTIVSSANFTLSDFHGDFANPESRGNANNLVKIDSVPLSALFTVEFNLMWGDGIVQTTSQGRFGVKKPYRPPQGVTIGKSLVWVQFSPASRTLPWEKTVNGFIANTLARSQYAVDMALFVFSDQSIANQLQSLQGRGVAIRLLVDAGFLYRPFSEGLDLMGVTLFNGCTIEQNNRPWTNPLQTVGTPDMPQGDLLHHKFAVMDGTTVITGSHNWSDAANHLNDETLLVIQNPTIAAHYQREFERLYSNARLGVPPFVQKQLQKQSQDCKGNHHSSVDDRVMVAILK